MQPICTHTISVQSAKPSHSYPIIWLPREFRRLAGAAATIYETTHNGALAFLVVPHRKRKGHKTDSDADTEKTSLYTARSGVRIASSPSVFFDLWAAIVSDDEDDREEKLPTDEELLTSANDDNNQEKQPKTVIVEEPGGIIVYRRGPDCTLDEAYVALFGTSCYPLACICELIKPRTHG